MTKTAGFTRDERLKSKKAIDELMRKGRRQSVEGMTMVYRMTEEDRDKPIRMAVSVPKKLFKRAVDRNVLKRRIREAFRLHKAEINEVLQKDNKAVNLMFIYQHQHLLTYTGIEEKIVLLLKGLISGHE